MESKYKVGQAVLFINGYGLTSNSDYMYRYGQVVAGFVTNAEYIEPRNMYLYTIGTLAPTSVKKVMYRTLGEHYIFNLDEEDIATLKLCELCEEPDDE